MDEEVVTRTTAGFCAYQPGPDGYLLVDCAVSPSRMPGTRLPCTCVTELSTIQAGLTCQLS